MSRGRRGMVWVGLPLLLFIALLIAARAQLSSRKTANAVADRLQTMFGVEVRVSDAQVGLVSGSSVENLQIFEAGEDASAKPWIHVDQARANVAAVNLLNNGAPNDITLQGMACALRFDRQGKLLTRLPALASADSTNGSALRLHIADGCVKLLQEGREPMIINGIVAEVSQTAGYVELKGTIDDPYWGKWRATGKFDPATGMLTLHLLGDKIAVDQAKLEALPFVPANVWRQVRAEGVTPVDFTLRLNAKAGQPKEIRYRVVLAPENTRVHIASIHLDADRAKGKIAIEDRQVQLRDVTGRSADGEILTNADLDFRSASTSMRFVVSARDMDLRKLPTSWSIPLFDGLLTGLADLRLTIQNGKLKTAGWGEGTINNAQVTAPLSKPIAFKPIRLELKADGDRFRLNPARTAIKTFLPGLIPLLSPGLSALKGESVWGTEIASIPLEMALRGSEFLMRRMVAKATAATRAVNRLHGKTEAGEAPQYLEANLAVENVDLGPFLDRLGIEMPVPIDGNLSFDVEAGIPINAPTDLKAYRLRGTAKFSRLDVGRFAVDEVETRVRYADGVLLLENLHGATKSDGADPISGSFDGALRYNVIPSGDLIAQLNLKRVSLDTFLRLLPKTDRRIEGGLSGNLELRIAAGRFRDPAAWEGKAKLRADGFEAFGLKARQIEGTFALDKGKGTLSDLTVDAEALKATGLGEVLLTDKYPYKMRMEWPRLTLADVRKWKPEWRVPFVVEGTADLHVEAMGSLLPFSTAISGGISAPSLRWQKMSVREVKVDVALETTAPLNGQGKFSVRSVQWGDREEATSVQGVLRFSPKAVQIREIAGRVGGGKFKAKVALNLADVERSTVNLSFSGVEGSRILPPLQIGVVPVRGQLAGRLNGRFDRTWRGSGELLLERGKIAGIDAMEARAPFDFSYQPLRGRAELKIHEFNAKAANGRMSGRADFHHDPLGQRLEGSLCFVDTELRGLLGAFGDVGSVGQGRLTGRLDFNGSDLRSMEDLGANLNATFSNAHAFDMPVLRALGPSIGQAPDSAFHNGDIRASLTQGMIRVHRLTLTSGLVDLLLDGRVTLQGRLNLNVTTRGGTGGSDRDGLRSLWDKIPLVGPASSRLLTDATGLLAASLVHFRVTGTVRNPVVRAQPLPLLTDDAVRFFMQRSGPGGR